MLLEIVGKLLDIVKLLFSKEARDTIAAWKSNPEWRKELSVVSAKFKARERDLAEVFIQHTAAVLSEKKGWPAERAGVAEFVAKELVANAYLHRPADEKSRVEVNSSLHLDWAEYTVKSRSSAGFDLANVLEEQRQAPRGLTFVRLACSSLAQPRRDTVTARIDRVASNPNLAYDGEIVVVSFTGSLDHSSVEQGRELLDSVPASARLIIDLSSLSRITSVGLRELMVQRKKMAAPPFHNDAIALIVSKNSTVREVLRISRFDLIFVIAESMDEARQAVIAVRTPGNR